MIWTTVGKIMALAGLSLLMETSIASAQIFQWTDVKGVIHFTDNPYSIPESIRNFLGSHCPQRLGYEESLFGGQLLTLSQPAEISSTTNPSDTDSKSIATTLENLCSTGSDRGGDNSNSATTEPSSLQLRQPLQTRLSSETSQPAIYSPERV